MFPVHFWNATPGRAWSRNKQRQKEYKLEFIKYNVKNDIATITMDRDEKRNALSDAMSNDIIDCINAAQKEKVRVIILRANPGVSVWCSGHDLVDLPADTDFNDNPLKSLLDRIEDVPIPVISMVEGAVYAGGVLIAVSSDIVIAADNAKVVVTANKMGIPIPTNLYAYFLKVVGLHKIKELFFTASAITPQDAYVAGIYNHVVEGKKLETFTYDLAQKIIVCLPGGIVDTKLQLNKLSQTTCLSAEDMAIIEQHRQSLIKSPDLKKGIDKLLRSIKVNKSV
jgi:methylmalonyl-CoA decarboxylase